MVECIESFGVHRNHPLNVGNDFHVLSSLAGQPLVDQRDKKSDRQDRVSVTEHFIRLNSARHPDSFDANTQYSL